MRPTNCARDGGKVLRDCEAGKLCGWCKADQDAYERPAPTLADGEYTREHRRALRFGEGR